MTTAALIAVMAPGITTPGSFILACIAGVLALRA
jgi:hypothetical protein